MPFILLIQPPKKMNNKITMNKNKRNPKKTNRQLSDYYYGVRN